jgi:tripartite-type tricarboxylate transporter receptor subunit TctC
LIQPGHRASLRPDVKSVNSPDVKDKLAQIGVDPAPTTPEELAVFARAETEKWGKVVKATGATVD